MGCLFLALLVPTLDRTRRRRRSRLVPRSGFKSGHPKAGPGCCFLVLTAPILDRTRGRFDKQTRGRFSV